MERNYNANYSLDIFVWSFFLHSRMNGQHLITSRSNLKGTVLLKYKNFEFIGLLSEPQYMKLSLS